MGMHDAVSDAARWMNDARASAKEIETSEQSRLLTEAKHLALGLLAENYPDTADRVDHGALAVAVVAFADNHNKWGALRAALMTAGLETNPNDNPEAVRRANEALQTQVQRWRERVQEFGL